MTAERRDLLASVLPLAKALRRVEDAAAAQHGLTMWQYAILLVISDSDGLNQSEAAARLDYSRNRIIADLDHLEGRGLLARTKSADRRSNVLAITAAGVEVMRATHIEIGRGEDALLGGLSPTMRRDLDRALAAAARAVRAQG